MGRGALPAAAILHRSVSGVIALACVAWGFVQSFGLGLMALVVYSGILCLIWYGDELGRARFQSRYHIAPGRPSPGSIVASIGWFLLVGLPVVLLVVLKDWRE